MAISRSKWFVIPALGLSLGLAGTALGFDCPSPYDEEDCNGVCTDETYYILCDGFYDEENYLWAVTDGNNPYIWGYLDNGSTTLSFCCKQADVGYKDEIVVHGHSGGEDDIRLVYSSYTWHEDAEIYTFAGDDNVYGGNDDNYSDEIDGGTDEDTLWGYAGDDEIDGGQGNDEIHGGPDADTITCGGRTGCYAYGEAGSDTITGTTAGDHLSGGSGQDDISGLGGNDYLCAGADVYADAVDAGAGSGDWCYVDNDEDIKSGCENTYNTEGYCPF